MLQRSFQEDTARAHQAESEGSGDGSAASKDGDQDSDKESTSSVGLQSDDSEDEARKKKKKHQRKGNQKGKAIQLSAEGEAASAEPDSRVHMPDKDKPDKAEKVPVPKKGAAPKKESRAAKAKQEKADKTLTAAKKADASLREISLDMLWRSVIRAGEIERRIQKSQVAKKDLQAVRADGYFLGEDSVTEMGPFRDTLTQAHHLCRDLRGFTTEKLAEDLRRDGGSIAKPFLKVFPHCFSPDDLSTISDMLLHLSKKMWDAPCMQI